MSTALHQRMLAFNQGDDERNELMARVWRDTPWMVDAYVGSRRNNDRERDMIEWCFEQFGQEASPIHGKPGRWYRGSATIFAWTWFGFSTEAEMQAFIKRWPTPEGVPTPPQEPAGAADAAASA